MTSTGLTKLYAQLLPRERLPLILAAQARGDQQEQQRLEALAPLRVWRLPDLRPGLLGWSVGWPLAVFSG
jgi:hypothetical protein